MASKDRWGTPVLASKGRWGTPFLASKSDGVPHFWSIFGLKLVLTWRYLEAFGRKNLHWMGWWGYAKRKELNFALDYLIFMAVALRKPFVPGQSSASDFFFFGYPFFFGGAVRFFWLLRILWDPMEFHRIRWNPIGSYGTP